MNIKSFILPVLLVMLIVSCQKKTSMTENQEDGQQLTSAANCTYSFDKDSTKVSWIAYKFTERTGVGGVFDKFELLSTSTSSSPLDILAALEFSVETGSINTANPDRDNKIVSFFFGNMTNTSIISGKVNSLEGNDLEGIAQINLKINDVEQTTELKYNILGSQISLIGNLDLNNWEASGAVDALNQACEVLHTGADGSSTLWPDVDIEITSVLNYSCE